jgi:DNA polymerase (family X)
VIYVDHDGSDREHQFTVVTETSGPLRGLRVIRGRESECIAHYGHEPRPVSQTPLAH